MPEDSAGKSIEIFVLLDQSPPKFLHLDLSEDPTALLETAELHYPIDEIVHSCFAWFLAYENDPLIRTIGDRDECLFCLQALSFVRYLLCKAVPRVENYGVNIPVLSFVSAPLLGS